MMMTMIGFGLAVGFGCRLGSRRRFRSRGKNRFRQSAPTAPAPSASAAPAASTIRAAIALRLPPRPVPFGRGRFHRGRFHARNDYWPLSFHGLAAFFHLEDFFFDGADHRVVFLVVLEKVGYVQERIAVQPDVDKRRLHSGQHARDTAFVDTSG